MHCQMHALKLFDHQSVKQLCDPVSLFYLVYFYGNFGRTTNHIVYSKISILTLGMTIAKTPKIEEGC